MLIIIDALLNHWEIQMPIIHWSICSHTSLTTLNNAVFVFKKDMWTLIQPVVMMVHLSPGQEGRLYMLYPPEKQFWCNVPSKMLSMFNVGQ